MKLVIFGLSVSSSWGNGHATIWRSLLNAMAARGHSVLFYEKDLSYYADTRDGWHCPSHVQLKLYRSLEEAHREATREMADADLALWTSYCPEGARVARMILESEAAIKAFYDLDTPVTLAALRSGATVEYLPEEGLDAFDLVLSYTGGRALTELQTRLGGRRVAPLFGTFDPETHRPMEPDPNLRGALSYLGTYAADRQAALLELFVKPAMHLKQERFLLAGAQYPDDFPWQDNMYFVRHLPPMDHSRFLCSSRATLNVTRASMAEYGYCPSGRLFEAAACGVPILSDWWEGLDSFFAPEKEILGVRCADDVLRALSLSDAELRSVAAAARDRLFAHHSASQRVAALEAVCESVLSNRELSKPATPALAA